MSPMIESSNSLSASSNTRYLTFSRYSFSSVDYFDNISNVLPGVPTIIWGILSNSDIYLLKSTPPTRVAILKLMGLPNIISYSAICIANSLFAVSTIANTPWGSLLNSYKIGSANVAVLPLPVSAFAAWRKQKGKYCKLHSQTFILF